MAPTEETFTDDQINQAIKQFLEYGEQTFHPEEDAWATRGQRSGHKGYFSGHGWAARALRYHLAQRERQLTGEY